MLLLPVLLILAAAFLATSLTGAFTSENDLTGNAINAAASGRCEWRSNMGSSTNVTTQICPNHKPTVISGGCNVFGNQATLVGSNHYSWWNNGTQEQGWTCTSNQQAQALEANAFCCRI